MSKKVYFLDSIQKSDGEYDNIYGTDDINAIVSNLVGAGVAPFPSGDTYDVSELNSLTSALVEEGTSFDGLKVNFSDNKIHISQGIGYFENGATIVVDSEGEELEYTVAETLYVYAEYNQALNTCGFLTSESEPTTATGIYTLMLATITADGTVTDKRTVAQSKVATLGKNKILELYRTVISDGGSAVGFSSGKTICEVEVKDLSRYNNLYIMYHYDTLKEATYCIPVSELSNYNGKKIGGNFYLRITGNLLEIYNGSDTRIICYPPSSTNIGTIIFLA